MTLVLTLHYKAEVHHALATFDNEIEYAVPQVVELLKDSNLNVRLAIVDVIKKLAEKGK